MPDNARQESRGLSSRVAEALDFLVALRVPSQQQNERSALTLLALLGMTSRKLWRDAEAPMLGITEMMTIFREEFGKNYAPNTRETVRRFTIHQLIQLGLVIANPDNPERPINSRDNRYQVTPSLLKLARAYKTRRWLSVLEKFMANSTTLDRLHPTERAMRLLPIKLPNGKRLNLTAGGQNELVKQIVEEFCPRFTPGGVVAYLGDAGKKHRYIDIDYLEQLGLKIDEHGKMPDLVVHLVAKNWLILIEAVTSHGPIGLKRHNELRALFSKAQAGLVFVTAFPSRRLMTKYLTEISWETEVWIAEAPSHIIHFNGERFLGPYD